MEWVVRGMSVAENTPYNETATATNTVESNSSYTTSKSAATGSDFGASATGSGADSAASSREALRDYLAAPKLLHPCPFVTNDTTDLPQFTLAGCRAIETIAETSTGASLNSTVHYNSTYWYKCITTPSKRFLEFDSFQLNYMYSHVQENINACLSAFDSRETSDTFSTRRTCRQFSS